MNFVVDGAFCWCWASVPCLDFFFSPKGRDKYLNLKVRGFLSWKLNESDLQNFGCKSSNNDFQVDKGKVVDLGIFFERSCSYVYQMENTFTL